MSKPRPANGQSGEAPIASQVVVPAACPGKHLCTPERFSRANPSLADYLMRYDNLAFGCAADRGACGAWVAAGRNTRCVLPGRHPHRLTSVASPGETDQAIARHLRNA